MVYRGTIDATTRAYIKFHGDGIERSGDKKRDIAKWLSRKCHVSLTSVYRIMNEGFHHKVCLPTSRKGVGGRKRKLSQRTQSLLLRKVGVLRKVKPNWCAQDLLTVSGIDNISLRTVQRVLNENGYKHRVARKKGILKERDVKVRLCFAKQMSRKKESFWREDIAFYFDGAGFIHKSRPKEDALACRGKVWRKKCEGLALGCTSKGCKAGYGGRQAKFFVAISYNCGVICAEQYTVLNGTTFAQFIDNHFRTIFCRTGKSSNRWIQDGDPSQNSAKARRALEGIDARLVSIPPRSPDLNPIENVFALVKKELRAQVLTKDIDRESFDEFVLRVKATLYSTSPTKINTVIDSMNNRMSRIIVRKGGRIEY